MKAIRKKPGCAPELVEVDNTLKALQTEVGGYIETVSIADVVIICNEEGRRYDSCGRSRPRRVLRCAGG